MEKVAIAGASVAGYAAVRASRRESFAGEAVVAGAECHPPLQPSAAVQGLPLVCLPAEELALGEDPALGDDLACASNTSKNPER